MLRGLVLWVPLLVLPTGCWSDHGLTPAPTADGGTRDAAPRDAGLEDAGADCVPRLEVEAECHARWALALGGGDFATRLEALDVDMDGAVYALVLAPRDARVVIDGEPRELPRGHVALALDANGAPRWAVGGRGERLLAEHHGRVVTTRVREAAAEHLAAADGSVIRAEPPDGANWLDAVHGDCSGAECGEREGRLATWTDELDLGSLGVARGAHGLSVTMTLDGTPAWHWSSALRERIWPLVELPQGGVERDGSLWLSIFNARHDATEPVCLEGAPCFDRRQSLLAHVGREGVAAAWTVDHGRIWGVERVDEDVIVGVNDGFIRFAPDGAIRWEALALGGYTGALTVDVEGVMRSAFGIALVPLEVLGTTFVDCRVGLEGWAAEHYVLYSLDPRDGRVLSLDGRLSARPRFILRHPAGGVLVAFHPRVGSSSVELCGREVRRGDDPDGEIGLVIAHID